jgi:hypothetical protein
VCAAAYFCLPIATFACWVSIYSCPTQM